MSLAWLRVWGFSEFSACDFSVLKVWRRAQGFVLVQGAARDEFSSVGCRPKLIWAWP